ncbi:DNA recombination protein RmuC [Bizionia hallyeonensis]|uniref:DNA recombination protein RmuC n=1 Tax=Bizionia hallyeonensis TaxID=1123757 RepID=A0ABW0C3A0_9FLAO
MVEIIVYIVIGIIVGFIIGWFISKSKTNSLVEEIKTSNQSAYADLDKEFIAFKSTANSELQQSKQTLQERDEFITEQKQNIQSKTENLDTLQKELATKTANFTAAKHNADSLKAELDDLKIKFNASNEKLATATANNKALDDKLTTQKDEIEALGKKFNTEFKNIASEILKSNTESFSETNKEKLKDLLEPLGKNIKEFKEKVEDVYVKESQQRFSLGEKVKELAEKSDKISQDAINLTNALKGEAKTQGKWGEMILESILEKSGLRKDEEYFMEHELKDENGKALRSDSEGKKMRPDAVIKYPDNRNVIIDSKTPLNAFTRLLATSDVNEQQKELGSHVSAIKAHIIALSTKGYDDYDKALDFVMMFIPSEPAYIAAMQGDPNLWNYAYDKRILLMNPTNLIISLKLIVDLWKREYQNQNAIAIAERGAKLYDKFVGFVENLEKVGKHIGIAQSSYKDAYKQLSTGNDNLVLQANKLKELGVKNKKELSKEIESNATSNKLTE